MDRSACTLCGTRAPLLYVVEGRIGTYYECSRCHGVDEPALVGPELITDTFSDRRTASFAAANATEAGLHAILDRMAGLGA